MLMMRLQRVGRKNDPSYRIVVTDKRTGPKSSKHVDLLGFYSPKSGTVEIDAQKVQHWLSHGVKPSITLHNMLVSKKLIEGKKLNPLPRKSPIVDEEALKKAAEEEAAKAAAAEAPEEASAAEAAPEETETAEPAA